MRPRDALNLGVLLLLAGTLMYVFSSVGVRVVTISSGSAYSFTTYNEYECGRFGRSSWCVIFVNTMYGGAGLLTFVGAILVGVSLYRLVEAPHAAAVPPPPLGSCPRCGMNNPPKSKYCSECATKLT
jgi:hypothetical protein